MAIVGSEFATMTALLSRGCRFVERAKPNNAPQGILFGKRAEERAKGEIIRSQNTQLFPLLYSKFHILYSNFQPHTLILLHATRTFTSQLGKACRALATSALVRPYWTARVNSWIISPACGRRWCRRATYQNLSVITFAKSPRGCR